MGTPGSIFEAITQRSDDQSHPNSGWTTDIEDRHDRVSYTHNAVGVKWHYTIDCQIEDHGHIEVTAYQCVRWRDPAPVLIPHGSPRSLQEEVNDFFLTGAGPNFSFPGAALRPMCGETFIQTDGGSLWAIYPYGVDNAPDRLFLASSRVDANNEVGEPPSFSPRLMFGVEYCLVAVIYSLPNLFVAQLRFQ